MASKKTEKIILGSLMKEPLLLSEVEKYIITVDDFDNKTMQYIFYAIASIATEGSTKIKTQDVHLFLKDTPTGLALFESNNGIALLNDAIELANEESFSTYYNLFKKENLLRDLSKMGFDTKEFYDINPITQEAVHINNKYIELGPEDIVNTIKMKLLKVENDYLKNDASETLDAYEGVEDLIEQLMQAPDVGIPLAGDIFNTAVRGARKGKFYVRSAASNTGKSRNIMAEACQLAFPISYNQKTCQWEKTGYNEKVLVVITEQEKEEIDTMILAYLTGMDEEDKIKMMINNSKEELELIRQAAYVMKRFKDNLFITRMPNPSIQVAKTIIRQNVMLHDIEYVFYDYIFVGPALLHEFRGYGIRNDEALLMFSTALKDIAVEQGVFMSTSTQVNSKADDNKNIKNEGSIAGARAVINKADVGSIMSEPTNEELEILKDITAQIGVVPNIVTDLYKNRGGKWKNIRIWSHFDKGTLRKYDLFVTDSRLLAIENFHVHKFHFDVDLEDEEELLNILNS